MVVVVMGENAHVTNVVVSKCWNKPNVTSRRVSTLGRLASFALRDEVTGVIIVQFVGGKTRLQMESKTRSSPLIFQLTRM